MPETFCYLIGAGASCNVLPVSENFPEKMEKFLSDYDAFREDLDRQKPSNPNISTDSLKYEQKFKESMAWLIKEVKQHTSVDTFAKMLYLTNDYEDLARLKATLDAYLVMAQAKYGTDLRYDSFLATILQQPPRGVDGAPFIPNHIRIVTWNYDLQLEKAFYRYSRNADGNTRTRRVYDAITNNPHIKRVNGLAGLSELEHFDKRTKAALRPFDIETVLTALEIYSVFGTGKGRFFCNIEFAWEKDPEKFKSDIASAIEDATILIDIGYSFPFFNREIDRCLLACMGKLKKIYIQVLEPEHDAIKERLQSIMGKLPEVKNVYDKKRFHIPYEL